MQASQKEPVALNTFEIVRTRNPAAGTIVSSSLLHNRYSVQQPAIPKMSIVQNDTIDFLSAGPVRNEQYRAPAPQPFLSQTAKKYPRKSSIQKVSESQAGKVELVQTIPAPSLQDLEREASAHAMRLEHRLAYDIMASMPPESGPPLQQPGLSIPEPSPMKASFKGGRDNWMRRHPEVLRDLSPSKDSKLLLRDTPMGHISPAPTYMKTIEDLNL